MRRSVMLTLGCVAIWSNFAWSQAYPSRPIRLVVPFAPGGTIDAYARALARQVESQIGQSIVIDNRAGANGIVGADTVAKAAPDGYTLLNNAASFVINASMYKKLPYDTDRDFTPITNFVKGLGYLLVAHPSVPANSVKELLELAKKKPDAMRYSSPGIGNGQHLAFELMSIKTGTQLLHVPYKGSAPALAAVLGGEVHIGFQTPTSVVPHITSGKLKALGFSGDKRLPALPNVPTVAEAGVPGYEAGFWYGMLAPARTPEAIIRALNAQIDLALKQNDVIDKLASQGVEPYYSTPQAFSARIKEELPKWMKVITAAGVKIE